MTISRKSRGALAEEYVVSHLIAHGYSIRETNYVIKNVGELDIIAELADLLCFVEVRSRSSAELGDPFETVGPTKQQKLRRLAETYLDREAPDRPARFDVASVTFDNDGKPELDYIEDAFE